MVQPNAPQAPGHATPMDIALAVSLGDELTRAVEHHRIAIVADESRLKQAAVLVEYLRQLSDLEEPVVDWFPVSPAVEHSDRLDAESRSYPIVVALGGTTESLALATRLVMSLGHVYLPNDSMGAGEPARIDMNTVVVNEVTVHRLPIPSNEASTRARMYLDRHRDFMQLIERQSGVTMGCP
ncbi:hypothetical protein PINS_up008945 [Pythium insidiosum]|nr:hypothetical protein PINS_up008945 [Pythium insidiosum]